MISGSYKIVRPKAMDSKLRSLFWSAGPRHKNSNCGMWLKLLGTPNSVTGLSAGVDTSSGRKLHWSGNRCRPASTIAACWRCQKVVTTETPISLRSSFWSSDSWSMGVGNSKPDSETAALVLLLGLLEFEASETLVGELLYWSTEKNLSVAPWKSSELDLWSCSGAASKISQRATGWKLLVEYWVEQGDSWCLVWSVDTQLSVKQVCRFWDAGCREESQSCRNFWRLTGLQDGLVLIMRSSKWALKFITSDSTSRPVVDAPLATVGSSTLVLDNGWRPLTCSTTPKLGFQEYPRGVIAYKSSWGEEGYCILNPAACIGLLQVVMVVVVTELLDSKSRLVEASLASASARMQSHWDMWLR